MTASTDFDPDDTEPCRVCGEDAWARDYDDRPCCWGCADDAEDEFSEPRADQDEGAES